MSNFKLYEFIDGQPALAQNGTVWRFVGLSDMNEEYPLVVEPINDMCVDVEVVGEKLLRVSREGYSYNNGFDLVDMVNLHDDEKKYWTPNDYWQWAHSGNLVQWMPLELGTEPRWSNFIQYRLHPHNNEMKAFDSGSKIQIELDDGSWFTVKDPDWSRYHAVFRVKPKKIKTHKIGDLVMVWNDVLNDAKLKVLVAIIDNEYYTNKTTTWKNCLTPKQWSKEIQSSRKTDIESFNDIFSSFFSQ